MSDIELFGKNYDIKDFICNGKDEYVLKDHPGVILYVRISNNCNGNCKFCLNCNNTSYSDIDLDKLKFIVKYLFDKKILSTVTITGGEPMLNPDKLNETINAIVSVVPNIKISVSTNGTNLEKFINFDNIKNVEAIHISRHHFDDKINFEIIGTNTITSEKIKMVQSMLNNIIINTVMIKGYIDSLEKVFIMCKYAQSLGVKRLHLVSLIDYNEYCKENYVDVNPIFQMAEKEGMIKNIYDRYRKSFCECHLYYFDQYSIDELLVMSRTIHQNNCDYVEQLVYTNDNKLITGFDSKDIVWE